MVRKITIPPPPPEEIVKDRRALGSVLETAGEHL